MKALERALAVSALAAFTIPSAAQTIVRLTFDELRAADDGPLVVPFETSGYFGERNIPILAYTLGTQSVIASVVSPPVPLRVITHSPRNFFTSVAIPGEPEPAFGVIWRFAVPVAQFSVWRCGLDVREGEIAAHPAWSLLALDSAGEVVAWAQEAAFAVDGPLAPRRFEVRGTSISRVMITATPGVGDSLSFPLLDDVEMVTVPSAGTPVALAAAALLATRRRAR